MLKIVNETKEQAHNWIFIFWSHNGIKILYMNK